MSDLNKFRGPHQSKYKPISPDSDVFGLEGVKVPDPNNVKSADERKTVIADADFENLDFDDRVWLWWRENKKSVILAVVVSFVLIIGVNAYKLVSHQAMIAEQTAYNACSDAKSLEEFALNNGGTLGAVAALQSGDDLFKNAKFAEAKSFYAKAEKGLKGNPLLGRAALGVAFSEIALGNKAEGKKALADIVQNAQVNEAFKIQAQYELGVMEFADGNKDAAKKTLQAVADNPASGMYGQQANSFILINIK